MAVYKKGFSLLELLIVMGITAALMGLGFLALINFQDSTELQNTYSDAATLFRTTQNRAKNGVISQAKRESDGSVFNSIPDYYAVFLRDERTIDLFYCDEATSGSVNCFIETEMAGVTSTRDIEFAFTGCNGFGFEALTGDIIRIFDDASYVTTDMCEVTITHNNINRTRSIFINADTNVLELDQ